MNNILNKENIEDLYPLSPLQEGMLFHAVYQPESPLYFEQFRMELKGGLNVDCFEKAWNYVISNNSILRTVFRWKSLDKPIQVVLKKRPLELIVHQDICFNKESIDKFLVEDRANTFSMEEGPLLRLNLLSKGNDNYLFVWSFHHIILDGWSIPVLLNELIDAYTKISGDETLHYKKGRNYKDYITWLSKQDVEKANKFWKEHLDSITNTSVLPFVNLSKKRVAKNVINKEFFLDKNTSQELEKFAKKYRVTPNVVIQAAWGILLQRLSLQNDVVYGTTFSGRPGDLPGAENMIGLFINTLPVRLKINPEESLSEFLKNIQQQLVQLQDYQYSSISDIRSIAEIKGDAELFQTLLVFENFPSGERKTSGKNEISIGEFSYDEMTNFPVTLVVASVEGKLVFRCSFIKEQVEEELANKITEYMQTLLHNMLEVPDANLNQLDILSEVNIKQVLFDLNRGQEKPKSGNSLHGMYQQQVKKTPDAVAVSFEGESLTYQELDKQTDKLAHYLVHQGITRDSLVGVCMERSIELVVSLLGVLKAGAAYVPVDPDYPKDRLDYILQSSGVTVLLTQKSVSNKLPEYMGSVLCLDTGWQTQFSDSESAEQFVDAHPDQLAYVIYTSGSTGKPKGVAVPHSGVVNRLEWMQAEMQLNTDDVVLQKTPFSFDVSVWEFFWPLVTGARLVLAKPEGHKDPMYLVDLIKREGVTTLHFVPPMLSVFLEYINKDICSSIKRVICSGEALKTIHVSDFFSKSNAHLYNLYGPTEASIDVTSWRCQQLTNDSEVPIGFPIWNTQMYILDNELNPVPLGVPGELYIAGIGLARCYINQPGLTAEKFIPSPFSTSKGSRLYRSGDLARFLSDGNIEYHGRIDHQVKIRGNRIELGEIESVLSQLSEVDQCVVTVKDGETGVKKIVAYVVINPSSMLTNKQLSLFLGEQLPDYMLPSVYVYLDELPLTSNGKVDRKQLPNPKGHSFDLSSNYEAPDTELEKSLVEVWSAVLNIEQVGIHDNFFDLGGDSILSIQIISRLNQKGINLEPKQIFQYQTISQLAGQLKEGSANKNTYSQESVSGSVLLTPVQQWFFQQDFSQPGHWNHAVLLKAQQAIDENSLKTALSTLLDHHDALRMRYFQIDGSWIQTNGKIGECISLISKDLSTLATEAQESEMLRLCEQLHSTLDLEKGPLLQVAIFRLSESDVRLFIVIHHLVVDGVSWRILLEDLQMAYSQLQSGQAVTLPMKTASYQDWANWLDSQDTKDKVSEQIAYWSAIEKAESKSIPVDHYEGEILSGSTETVVISLNKNETQQLLSQTYSSYHADVNELLITAFLMGLKLWKGIDVVKLDLESHGRDGINGQLDTSRTVGWFTAIHPILASLSGSKDIGEQIKRIKEQVRSIPDKGVGYGILKYLAAESALQQSTNAEIMFNYLGRFDQFTEQGIFQLSAEPTGALIGKENKRTHMLDVNGIILSGELSVNISYSQNRFRKENIEILAESVASSLREIINHCMSQQKTSWTPSDITTLEVSQTALDELPDTTQDVYALSPLQKGLLFHAVYEPTSPVYFEQFVFSLEGELNEDVFQKTWEYLVDNTPVLRTVFRWEDYEYPFQVVLDSMCVPLQVNDLQHIDEKNQKKEISLFLDQDRQAGFDFKQGPLLRINLFKLTQNKYTFVWSYHHILMDGWCLPVLTGDILNIYASLSSGVKPHLNQRRNYKDYILWLSEQNESAALKFWQANLIDIEEPTLLAKTYAVENESDQQSVGSLSLTLPTELYVALDACQKRNRVTLSVVMQAAWSLVLSRYLQQSRVTFGLTVSGRPAELVGMENMLGLFINTMPLSVNINRDMPIKDWLQLIQNQNISLQKNSFIALSDIHLDNSSIAVQNLFDTIFVFENYPVKIDNENESSGLQIIDVQINEMTNFPLTVIVNPAEKVELEFQYRQDLFSAELIENMSQAYLSILKKICMQDTVFTEQLFVIPDNEYNNVINDFNNTNTRYKYNNRIIDIFEDQVDKNPQHIALVYNEEQLTYYQLNILANQYAKYLQDNGVKNEVVVGVYGERSIEVIVALIAIHKAGGAYLPLDIDYPEERIQYMIEDSRASVILAQAHLIQSFQKSDIKILPLSTDNDNVINNSTHNQKIKSNDENLAYLIYTSGSTGLPKGIGLTQKTLLNLIQWQTQAEGEVKSEKVLQFAPMNFDVSLQEIFSTLCTGGELHIISKKIRQDFSLLIDYINNNNIQKLYLPYIALRQLADQCLQTNKILLTSLTSLITAGEQLAITDNIKQWLTSNPQTKLFNHYGPSETHVVSNFLLPTNKDQWSDLPPIGKPIANTQLYILDKRLNPQPVGVVGELYIAGSNLGRGYLSKPDLTAENFIANPYSSIQGDRMYKTGDYARYLSSGDIEYVGRLDSQVKVNGYRIELSEIESVLRSIAGVKEAIVDVYKVNLENRQLIAYLSVDIEKEFTAQSIKKEVANRLPYYMVPAFVQFLDQFPVTPSGKLDRLRLPKPDGISTDISLNTVSARSSIEEMIKGIWHESLGVNNISINDDFFELGGNSLTAMQVVAKTKQLLNKEIPVRVLFEAPTIAEFSLRINEQEGCVLPAIQAVETREYYPVSHAQKRLWFLSQLDRESAAYNMPAVFKLEGIVDVGALQETIQVIVDRHHTLKTVFIAQDDQPMQWVLNDVTIDLPVTDISYLYGQKDLLDKKINSMIIKEAATPFNLETGPLLRSRLLKLDSQEYILFFTMHHIISDGWSFNVLVNEITTLYRNIVNKESNYVELSKLPVQYVDYSIWQNNNLNSGELDSQRQYWLDQLSGELPLLDLPTDYPRPPVQTFNGDICTLSVTEDSQIKLDKRCRDNSVTKFMWFVAVFQTLLFRLTGQTDIFHGTPIANRHHASLENLIGCLINVLVLRSKLSGDLSFENLLKNIKKTTLDAYTNQDYPFDLLVDKLSVDRDLGRQALFDVMFVYHTKDQIKTDDVIFDDKLNLKPVGSGYRQAKFDLTVSIRELSAGMEIEFEYNTDLFAKETIQRWISYFNNILQSSMIDPGHRISTINLLSEQERYQILFGFNEQSVVKPNNLCLHQLFEAIVTNNPQATALICDDESYTYEQLNNHANQLARSLTDTGVGPEVLTGLCVERSLDLVVGIMGILKAGGAYVPMDPEYPVDRLNYILEDTGINVLVTHKGLIENRLAFSGKQIYLDDKEKLRKYSVANLMLELDSKYLAYVIYTSGSTGKPKGTLLTHENVTRLLTVCQRDFNFSDNDVWTLFHSYCFDFSVWEIFGALTYGGKLVVVPQQASQSPNEFMKLLENNGVTVLNQTPSSFARLLDIAVEQTNHNWASQLKYVVFGGEALDLGILKPWYRQKMNSQTRLVNMYGITETTVHVTYKEVMEDQVHQLSTDRSIGTPLSDLNLYVLDAELNPAPIGIVGELYVSGAGLARGYLGRGDLSADRFIPNLYTDVPGDRLYKTGDLGKYTNSGVVEYIGRCDQQVKIRGFRIELGEIESVLEKHERINHCVVLTIKDRGQRERLVAYYTADETISVSILRNHLSFHLPEYMIPSGFIFLSEFPLTSNGKLDKKALLSQSGLASRPELEVNYVAASTDTELKLTNIWKEVLDIQQIGVHDNFFDLGGESFSAYRLMSCIADEFDKELPLVTIFNSPTIQQLGIYLEEFVESLDNQVLVLMQQGSPSCLPFFCIHPAGGDVLGFQQLSKQLGEDQTFYGIQSQGRFLDDRYNSSLEQMAEGYVNAILSVQKEGPYMVGGHSMGGIAAFEVVRQLEERGKKVAVLAVFDAEIKKKKTSMLDTLLMVSDMFGLDFNRNELSKHQGTEMMDQVLIKAKQKFGQVLEIAYEMDILPRGFRTKDAEMFLNRIATNIDLIANYIPTPICSDIYMYKATELSENAVPIDVDSWKTLTTGKLNIVPVPGDHLNLIKMPHVKVLSKKLKLTLDNFNHNSSTEIEI